MSKNRLITLAHGAGGRAMHMLIEELFLNAFAEGALSDQEDQARLPLEELTRYGDRLAFTTDSFVVTPLQFPGGDIGTLAVYGTVNDLAVGGARPLYLSASFIIEEGLEIAVLEQIVGSMAAAAKMAGVKIVTGDTKVVERGKADKLFINTAGVGVIDKQYQVGAKRAAVGDCILVNGYIGDHGAAIMLARDELGLSGSLKSDCAPLSGLISQLLTACPGMHAMRDATRGGVGVVLHEIAKSAGVTITLNESSLPLREQTLGLCELLGLEPLFFANEGLAVFVVSERDAQTALAVMHNHSLGQNAQIIGRISDVSEGLVSINNEYGGKRLIEPPHGIQLPRIC